MMNSQSNDKEEFFDATEDCGETASLSPPLWLEDGTDRKDLTLDDTSFELVKCKTALSSDDFYRLQRNERGEDELKQRYFEEARSFVESKLQCDKVVCVRLDFHDNNSENVSAENDSLQDYYMNGKPKTSSSTNSADELAMSFVGVQNDYDRYTSLSLWRYIEEEHVGDHSRLAVLDERTAVKPDDYITQESITIGRNGQSIAEQHYALNYRHASNHKWYYFPTMEMRNEALLLKEMDSDWTVPGRMCFRMNVRNPEGGVARKAIEVRMLCFWNDTASGLNTMPTVRGIAQTSEPVNAVPFVMPIKKQHSSSTDENTWLDKLIYGKAGLRDFVEKIEELSAGIAAQTEKKLPELMSRVSQCEAVLTPAGVTPERSDNPYFGRYTKEYSDGYDEYYRQRYLDTFVQVVDSYPSWPPSTKSWIRSEMRKFGFRELDRGIAEVTCIIVDDSMDQLGTKNLPIKEKRKIIDFLIRNEMYMHVAMTRLAPLAYDMPLQDHSVIEEDQAAHFRQQNFHLQAAMAQKNSQMPEKSSLVKETAPMKMKMKTKAPIQKRFQHPDHQQLQTPSMKTNQQVIQQQSSPMMVRPHQNSMSSPYHPSVPTVGAQYHPEEESYSSVVPTPARTEDRSAPGAGPAPMVHHLNARRKQSLYPRQKDNAYHNEQLRYINPSLYLENQGKQHQEVQSRNDDSRSGESYYDGDDDASNIAKNRKASPREEPVTREISDYSKNYEDDASEEPRHFQQSSNRSRGKKIYYEEEESNEFILRYDIQNQQQKVGNNRPSVDKNPAINITDLWDEDHPSM